MILVLGHKGMLGNCVSSYLRKLNYEITTTDFRWDSTEFKDFVKKGNFDFIINCIGAFPNRNSSAEEIYKVNYDLVIWLVNNSKSKLILAGTDGEFSGNISPELSYTFESELDAQDDYGKSKLKLTKELKNKENVRIIRTSIVGIEKNTSNSILSWFLNLPNNASINGYNNVWWSGITTLEWAKTAEKLINDWNCVSNEPLFKKDNIIQIASSKVSKYDLLVLFKQVFNTTITIKEQKFEKTINRCLFPYNKAANLKEQLIELKKYYGI